jgi:methylenetetrahydrofolate reductase (NADPH)
MANHFRNKLLNTDNFLLSYELVPGAGSQSRRLEGVLLFAKQAKEDGLLDALTITDNAGGNPSLSPDVLGGQIKGLGIDPVIHFSCRDWNRYGAFSRALQLDRLGLENLLVMTGDYPAEGKEGTAKPVFDIDAVTALCMLDGLNSGKLNICAMTTDVGLKKTNFFLGTTVACQKFHESEVITQYYKLLKKKHNGAQFVITQLCYDARKLHELILFIRQTKHEIPLIGSVCMLTPSVANFICKAKIPGIYMPEKLLQMVEQEGRSESIDRTARLLAVLKGLGYRGAHIVGGASYDTVKTIIKEFNKVQQQWQDFLPEFDFPYPGGFYLYEKDSETGLNKSNFAEQAKPSLCAYFSMMIMKCLQFLLFEKTALHYPLLKGTAKLIEKSRILTKLFFAIESISKKILFDCRKCGDCALSDMAYLCPESQCPKFLRNGPCGGSERTYCEVKKDRVCVWVQIYQRYKAHNERDNLKDPCIPPRNWALDSTSSWLNLYLDRDYHSTVLPFCERMRQQ